MRLAIEHLPAPGQEPWCIVLHTGSSEIRQERHVSRVAAEAALPSVARTQRRAMPGQRVEIQAA
ncbi:hypothetical protein ACLBYG_22250 [Methylobacterium sp. D53M]